MIVDSQKNRCGSAVDSSGIGVLAFAAGQIKTGNKTVLATLSGIEGSSPKVLGTQMAITENGESIGSISSGCVEHAIVEEGLGVLKENTFKQTRYGRGSKYIDLVLPCGSGIDVRYDVCQFFEFNAIEEKLMNRLPFVLKYSKAGISVSNQKSITTLDGADFFRRYNPRLRILIAGIGDEAVCLSSLAMVSGYEVIVVSPDIETLGACWASKTIHLTSQTNSISSELDHHSAVVSLLHEEKWDIAMLEQAIYSNAFYVGAIGSENKQVTRKSLLGDVGVSADLLGKLIGPIGLIPSTKDVSSLAISILAEVTQAWIQYIGQQTHREN